jgi:hypothetical protein
MILKETGAGKVTNNIIWHDRIHAKAMYRMATKTWNIDEIANPYYFY